MSGTSMDGIDISLVKTNGLELERLNKNYFYEYPLNSYIPVPSAIIIANFYGKRVPINVIEKYIKDSKDWVNTLTLELDTLNYSKLIEDKYLKYKDKN